MKPTTQLMVFGLALVLIGVGVLMYGAERHETVAILIVTGGMGMMGVKPVAHALNTNKEKKP